MNRSTFFKKCAALVGFGALINTSKSEEPIVSTPTSITLDRLQLTDGKSTYELVVENNRLKIGRVKTEEEKRAEESIRPTSCTVYIS